MNLQKSSKLKTDLYKANRAQEDMIKIFGKYQKRDHRISIKDLTQKDLDQLYQDSCAIGIDLISPIKHVGSIKNPTIYIPNKQFKKAHIFRHNKVIDITHNEDNHVQEIKLKLAKQQGISHKNINKLPKDLKSRHQYHWLIGHLTKLQVNAWNMKSHPNKKNDLLTIGHYCEILYNYTKEFTPIKFTYPIADILNHYHIRSVKDIQQLTAIQGQELLDNKNSILRTKYNQRIYRYSKLFKILDALPQHFALVDDQDKKLHTTGLHLITLKQFNMILTYSIERLKKKEFKI